MTAQNATSNDDEEEEDKTVSESQYVALMVVMPLFLCCYGGSCIAYVAYKIWRSCSHKALHAQFVKLHAAEYSSQMMPPAYPIIHDGFLAKKKEPYQPSTYLHEPAFGAAAAVSFFYVCICSRPTCW